MYFPASKVSGYNHPEWVGMLRFRQPGESKDVNITINKQALSFYDETAASWKAEAGKFEALVGNASDQLKLKKAFELK